MDIEYLLFLQSLRESVPTWFSDFLLSLSSFAVSIWPMIFIAIVFWVFDRKEGRKLIGALSLAMLFNGFLKATFHIYRPWIRDSRIEPYGNAKVEATGYSFPSGHSMYITPTVGGIGLWQWNKNRVLSVICFVTVALVLFSRNYLGCHTFQDVAVGCACGFFCIWLSGWIEGWASGDIKKDVTLAVLVFIVCAVLLIYYLNKSYPMDYKEDGTLLCDPAKLIADCFEGLGAMLAFYIARIFERRNFEFDKLMSWKDRFIIAVIACFPLYFWRTWICEMIMSWNKYFGKLLVYGVEILFIMLFVPWVMKKIHESGILNREKFD